MSHEALKRRGQAYFKRHGAKGKELMSQERFPITVGHHSFTTFSELQEYVSTAGHKETLMALDRDKCAAEADQLRTQLAALQVRERTLEEKLRVAREALRRVDHALTVPAAEYVPAIADAYKIIDAALKAIGEGES